MARIHINATLAKETLTKIAKFQQFEEHRTRYKLNRSVAIERLIEIGYELHLAEQEDAALSDAD